MIPKAVSLPSTPSTLKAFTPPSEQEAELFGVFGEHDGVLQQSERVARGFARGRFKSGDAFFLMEAIQEAACIVTELIWSNAEWQAIKEKYPDREERHKFFRMTVGYKLREYFSYRATSTLSFLKKKGLEVKFETVHEGHVVRPCSSLECMIALHDACENELQLRVVEFYSMGNSRELIASKCGLTQTKVKKLLQRVKRRLKTPSSY